MRLLHTSDWHVGKGIRGRSRADEHRAVFDEITGIADEQQVDVVLVAGDIFETSAPSAESEQIAFEALVSLADGGKRKVAVIAGNHDHAGRLAAVAPLLKLGNIEMLAVPSRPDDGGVLRFEASGVPIQLAMLPFVSQRGFVRSKELMEDPAFRNAQRYSERVGLVLERLCEPFDNNSVNIVMAHAFVTGGEAGGGERSAHLQETYQVSAQSFSDAANYVALGHLHKSQRVAGPTEIHYCGSPLQIDFGESGQSKSVKVVDIDPGLPARVSEVPLTSGCPLVTLRGTVDELAESEFAENAWLRVKLAQKARPGLTDEVRELLGDRVVDISAQPAEHRRSKPRPRTDRTAEELFVEYLAAIDSTEPTVEKLFAELLDEVESSDDETAVNTAGETAGEAAT